jgi:hypothetical protein
VAFSATVGSNPTLSASAGHHCTQRSGTAVSTFIHRIDEAGSGPRVAVKDLVAVAGLRRRRARDPAGLTAPVNLAGVPALSLPVPRDGRLPASLQLLAPHDGEELLVDVGARIESSLVPPTAT